MTASLRAYLARSPLNKGLFFLLLVISGASISWFVGFVISELFLGIPLVTQPSLLDNIADPDLLPALRTMQILQAFGMLIIPSVLYIYFSAPKNGLRSVFSEPSRQPVLISIAFFLVAFPLVNFLADWNSSWEIPSKFGNWLVGKEEQTGSLTKMFLDMPTVWHLMLNLTMIAILPALGEELVFRGIIQKGLYRLGNPHVAIWLTAILFSAVHMQILGFVPRMLMGVAMGYLFLWSGNLWYPIIAHLTNNAVAVTLSYGIQHGMIDSHLEDAGMGNAAVAAFSLAFCMMLLYVFKEHQRSLQLRQ